MPSRKLCNDLLHRLTSDRRGMLDALRMVHHRCRRQALTHLVGFRSLVVSHSTVTSRLLLLPGRDIGQGEGQSLALLQQVAFPLNTGYTSQSPTWAMPFLVANI